MTQPIAEEVARAARRLSRAQQRWLIEAKPGTGVMVGHLVTYPLSSTCHALHRLGLWWWCGMLTELGLAVRAHLEQTASCA